MTSWLAVTALPTPSHQSIDRAERLLRPLERYHRFRVEGLEHVPRSGPCLLVASHSLATYDGFLLGMAIVDATGRIPRGLGDRRIFQTPWLGGFAQRIGLVEASPTAGQELLAAGEIVGVAPGGMWESLRPRTERYQVRWGQRRGFVRLALRAQAPLLLTAVPRADEIFTVYPSRLTDRAYQRLHLPLPLARGLGPTALPRPVPLVGHIAPLIHPPPHDPEREGDQVEALFQRAHAAMQELMRRR